MNPIRWTVDVTESSSGNGHASRQAAHYERVDLYVTPENREVLTRVKRYARSRKWSTSTALCELVVLALEELGAWPGKENLSCLDNPDASRGT